MATNAVTYFEKLFCQDPDDWTTRTFPFVFSSNFNATRNDFSSSRTFFRIVGPILPGNSARWPALPVFMRPSWSMASQTLVSSLQRAMKAPRGANMLDSDQPSSWVTDGFPSLLWRINNKSVNWNYKITWCKFDQYRFQCTSVKLLIHFSHASVDLSSATEQMTECP